LTSCVAVLMTLGTALWADTPNAAQKADAGGVTSTLLHDEQLLEAALKTCPLPVTRQPRALDNAEEAAPRVLRYAKNLGAAYPIEARAQGRQGVLQVRLLVDALGNSRFAHVVYSFPTQPGQDLEDAAIKVAAHEIAIAPARSGGRTLATWVDVPVRFILQETDGPMGSLLDQKKWDKLRSKALEGDLGSIQEAAYVAGLVPGESGLSEQMAANLTVQSAASGEESARWTLIHQLSACAHASLVSPWVFADASTGSPQAQMWFAALLMDSGTNVAKTRELLGQLTRASDPFWRLWSAGILATSPVAAIRDPALALRVATALYPKPGGPYGQDPDYAEALAAAKAANGQYAAAVAEETEAIDWAKQYGWKTTMLQQRLASYQSHHAWTGYLCDCQKLAPGEW